MTPKCKKWIIFTNFLTLFLTFFLTLKMSVYINQAEAAIIFIKLEKDLENNIEEPNISNKDERIYVIVGIPEDLVTDDEKDCNWARTFLSQKNGSWICKKKGNSFKHRGYIFKLSKKKNLAFDAAE